MNKTKNLIALLMVFVILLLSSCSREPNNNSSENEINSASKNTRNNMTLLYSSSDTFNPYTATSDINRQLCKLLFEPLVKLDNEFNPKYSVAESVQMNKNVCTVKLKNLVFSDGSKVSSGDVISSYNLARKSTTEYAYKLYEVKSVQSPDSLTVIFNLNKADPYFLNLLDFPIIKSGTDNILNSDSVYIPPVGCGRYIVDDSRSNLLANKYYGKLSIEKIKLINAPDKDSIAHYVEIGAADLFYSDISDGSIMRMSGKKYNININHLVYLGINSGVGDLSLNSLRQALASGINRKAVTRDSFYNNAIPATGFFNPLWQPVKNVQNIKSDSDKEITIENLTEIGYNNIDANGMRKNSTGSPLKFDLLVNSNNIIRVGAAKLIASQLNEFGFRINVVEKPFDEYKALIEAGSFELYIGEVAIPANMDFTNLLSEGGSLSFGVNSPNKDKDDVADNNDNKEDKPVSLTEIINRFYKGENTITDIASFFLTEMPIIPICYRTGIMFYNENIDNVDISSMSDIYYSIESYKIND